MRIAVILRHSFAVAFRWRCRRPNQKVAAIGNAIASIDATILADRVKTLDREGGEVDSRRVCGGSRIASNADDVEAVGW